MSSTELKNLLIVTNEFPPIIGGAGIYISNLCAALAEQINRYRVTLVAPEGVLCSTKRVAIKKYKRITLFSIFSMLFTLRKIDFHVYEKIIINDLFSSLVFCFFYKKQWPKCIVIMHGLEPEAVFHNPRLLYRILNFKSRYEEFLCNCHSIVSVSYDLKNKFLELSKKPYMASKINILPPYIDESDFVSFDCAANLIDASVSSLFDNNSNVILSVSRIEPLKGYKRMFYILKPLLEQSSERKWVIVGDGGYKHELQELININNLQSKIFIFSGLDRKLFSYIYSSASVFFLLSEYRESFGLVYLEALSYQLRALGYDYGGVSEVLNNRLGVLIQRDASDEEIRMIVEDSISKSKLFQNESRDFVSLDNYSKLTFTNRIESILER